MKKPSTLFRRNLVWQRRLSSVLSAALCLWLLAFAAHLHAAGQDAQDGRSGTHYCEVCASMPSAAAAPAPAMAPQEFERDEYLKVALEASMPVIRAAAPYQSRAPPAR